MTQKDVKEKTNKKDYRNITKLFMKCIGLFNIVWISLSLSVNIKEGTNTTDKTH